MAISKRKLAANRANAQRSTGPQSASGKEAVSQNRTTHGLCGRFRVLASENQAEYDDLLHRFLQSEQPLDDVERELVAKMARHTWLSERAIRFQEACFLHQPQTAEQHIPDNQGSVRHSIGVVKDIDVYLRYQASHDRAYQRAANELAKRRNDRRLARRGFESQERATAEEIRREERQAQRAELHHLKVATAQSLLEHRQQRAATPNRTPRPLNATSSPSAQPDSSFWATGNGAFTSVSACEMPDRKVSATAAFVKPSSEVA